MGEGVIVGEGRAGLLLSPLRLFSLSLSLTNLPPLGKKFLPRVSKSHDPLFVIPHPLTAPLAHT